MMGQSGFHEKIGFTPDGSSECLSDRIKVTNNACRHSEIRDFPRLMGTTLLETSGNRNHKEGPPGKSFGRVRKKSGLSSSWFLPLPNPNLSELAGKRREAVTEVRVSSTGHSNKG